MSDIIAPLPFFPLGPAGQLALVEQVNADLAAIVAAVNANAQPVLTNSLNLFTQVYAGTISTPLAITMGTDAGSSAIAVGEGALATNNGSLIGVLAIGYGSTATAVSGGFGAVAIGTSTATNNAAVIGAGALAIGGGDATTPSGASGGGTMAIGDQSVCECRGGIAIGFGADVSGNSNNGIALGPYAACGSPGEFSWSMGNTNTLTSARAGRFTLQAQYTSGAQLLHLQPGTL